MLYKLEHLGNSLEEIKPGLYNALSYLYDFELDLRSSFYQFRFEYPEMQGDVGSRLKEIHKCLEESSYYSEYGSCDSPEQFMEHEYGKAILNSPHSFIVVFMHQLREDHKDRRWHKNGPHIGKLEPQYEHFGDEPEIEEIYSFHVYRKK